MSAQKFQNKAAVFYESRLQGYIHYYTCFENAASSKNGYTDEIVAFTAMKFPNDDDVERTFKENGISPSSLKVAARHTLNEFRVQTFKFLEVGE